MELQTLKCPDCSGRVYVDHSQNRAKCEYCGRMFLLKDNLGKTEDIQSNARQVGSELESGRVEPQSFVLPEVLADRLVSLRRPLKDLAVLESRLSDSSIKFDNLSTKLSEEKTLAGKLKVFVLPIIIIILMYAISSNGSTQTNSMVLGGVLALFSLILTLLIRRLRLSLLGNKTKASKAQNMDLQSKIRSLHERYDFSLIPEEYRNAEDVAFLINSLKTKRARTIEQAINLYEDMKHKQRMENYQRTQIELQKQLLEEAKISNEREDESNDYSIGKEILKGAAMVAGAAIISSIFKRKKS